MVQPSEGSHAFMVCALAKVRLMMLMAMRDGGVAFQAVVAKTEVATEKTGRWGWGWGSKRAKGMGDGGVADQALGRGRVTACA